eukprot:CAMPEP_0117481448 /NCGR_PEP_ID=MMETSP0784-20121206/12905_1 /TAXON_ID=39447 /ORGANISM="" /LENGTH=581 /DNA_ID=CAMNT_0005275905 /DNA_START=34 /DNA_END=1779 /DNA_ORIENTATION=+
MWLHRRGLCNSEEETDDEEFRPSRVSSSDVGTPENDQPRTYGPCFRSHDKESRSSSYSRASCSVLGVALITLCLLVSSSRLAAAKTAWIGARLQSANSSHALALGQSDVESVGRADTGGVVLNLERLNNHRAGTGAAMRGQGGGARRFPYATRKGAPANASERQQSVDRRFDETSARNASVSAIAARTVDDDAALRSPESGKNIDVVGGSYSGFTPRPVPPPSPPTRSKWDNAYDGARCGIGSDQAVVLIAGIGFNTDAARRSCDESESSWDRVACATDILNIVSGMSSLATLLTILTLWCSVGKADLGPAVPCAADWSRATSAVTNILAGVLGGVDECRPNATVYGPDGPPVVEWEDVSDSAMFSRFHALRQWDHASRPPRLRRRLQRRGLPEWKPDQLLRLSRAEQVARLRKESASIRARLQEHQDRVRRELDAREAERAARHARLPRQQELARGQGRRLQPLPLDLDRKTAIGVCANSVNSFAANLGRIGFQTAAAAIECGTTKTGIARLQCSVNILNILTRYSGATNGLFGVLATCPAEPVPNVACASEMLDVAASVIALGAFAQIFTYDCNLDNHI